MDPRLNPPAPSGRFDDTTKRGEGDLFVLPAGTTRYVDAAGAKHYVTPDGKPFYEPPGEMSFVIEGQSPREIVRQFMYQNMDTGQAAEANMLYDSAVDSVNQLRRLGFACDLVPSQDLHPEAHEAVSAALSRSDRAQWPKAKYHADGRYQAVDSEEAERDLGEGWHDNLADAKKAGDREGKPDVEPPAPARAKPGHYDTPERERDDTGAAGPAPTSDEDTSDRAAHLGRD